MPQVRSSATINLDQVIDRFESAWQTGKAPVLDAYLKPLDAAERRKLLAELIQIDLDYRWKRAAQDPVARGAAGDPLPRRPKLEDYVRRHGELGSAEQLPPELIAEEYCVRHCWGDKPGHAEYMSRFKAQAPRLTKLLARVDAELAIEQPFSLIVPRGERTPNAHLATVEDLLILLREKPLLTPKQYDHLRVEHLRKPFADARTLARALLERNWLTPFQANQIMTGQDEELVLGSFILLERLGEGMRGKVYKAWHGRLKRMVALKVIKKELLAEPETVSRFYQEIQAASQLSHPHVVHAYDAGPVDQTHFLAMEFVEGTDLARVVKQSGPLPPPLACEYARQVALGLQHAHEHGLVHRDIKPANLLLTRAQPAHPVGQVKILDLGLARLRKTAKDSGNLTQEGTVMGTPDYLSPEQALDPRQADIRTDLYSLGCTLYFLLTGQVPFPGGTLIQKVEAHRWQEPELVEKLRPDVPRPVAELVRKLMAKRPEDRYQAPKDVAIVLQTLAAGAAPAAKVVAGQQTNPPAAKPAPVARLLPSSRLAPVARLILPEKPRRLLQIVGGLCFLVGGFTLVFFLMRGSGTTARRGSPGNGIGPAALRLAANATWTDTFIEVRSGDVVTIKAAGSWKRGGAAYCSPDGNAAEAASQNLVPAFPAMCLLARIGDVDPPFVAGGNKVINARKPGRLFLQANTLPADGAAGEITVHVSGGLKSDHDAPNWVFGCGEFDVDNKVVKSFTPLPYIVGHGWQGGPTLPDPNTGWVFFRGDAGHPGDARHSAIRRWVVPHDAVITIAGTLSHAQPDGDGVQGRVVISRLGEVGSWTAQNSAVDTTVSRQEVKRGDVIDIVVESRGDPGGDTFTWRPVLFMFERATPMPE